MRSALLVLVLLVSAFYTETTSAASEGKLCAACVRLTQGVARGIIDEGVLSLKGIPYAAPPVGSLRFRPPAPPASWRGTLAAAHYRTVCPQIEDALERYPDAAKAHEIEMGGAKTRIYEDEDCLYLNIWKPAKQAEALPIMVYIPGGGFIVGGASDIYDGSALARRGVIVVTINYRIGFLGFAELGALDPSYSGSGNNGLRDQIAALKWVRHNAAALGGDPNNVTVFGESAGAISIAALLATPNPEQLFHRAILQSGGYNLILNKRTSHSTLKRFAGAGLLKTMADLKAAPVREILMQVAALGDGDGLFAPIADGSLIAIDPAKALASGKDRRINILLGTNSNEMNYWALYDHKYRNPFVEESDLGPKIDVFAALPYPHGNPEDVKKAFAKDYEGILGTKDKHTIEAALVGDAVMKQAATHMAERQSAAGGTVWFYRFDWRVPSRYLDSALPDLGAIHGIELPFMFGTGDFTWIPGGRAMMRAKLPEVSRLTSQMLGAWTNFAKDGDPNGDGVPPWPSYDTTKRVMMIWSSNSAAASDPDRARREVWQHWHFLPY